MATCPNCGKRVKKTEVTCPACHINLPNAPDSSGRSAAPSVTAYAPRPSQAGGARRTQANTAAPQETVAPGSTPAATPPPATTRQAAASAAKAATAAPAAKAAAKPAAETANTPASAAPATDSPAGVFTPSPAASGTSNTSAANANPAATAPPAAAPRPAQLPPLYQLPGTPPPATIAVPYSTPPPAYAPPPPPPPQYRAAPSPYGPLPGLPTAPGPFYAPRPGMPLPPPPTQKGRNTALVVTLSVIAGIVALSILAVTLALTFLRGVPGIGYGSEYIGEYIGEYIDDYTSTPAGVATSGVPEHILDPDLAVHYPRAGKAAQLAPADSLPQLQASLTLTQPVSYTNYTDNDDDDLTSLTTFVLPDSTRFTVDNIQGGYAASADGETIAYAAYLSDIDAYYPTLYLYQNETSTRIAPDVRDFYLSPVSCNLYYTRVATDDPSSDVLCVYSGGRETVLLEDVDAFLLSPNEEYILFTYDYSVYLLHQGETPVPLYTSETYLTLRSVSNDGTTVFVEESSTEWTQRFLTALTVSPANGTIEAESSLAYGDEFLKTLYIPYTGSEAVADLFDSTWHYTPATGFVPLYTGSSVLLMPGLERGGSQYTYAPVLCYVDSFENGVLLAEGEYNTFHVYVFGTDSGGATRVLHSLPGSYYYRDGIAIDSTAQHIMYVLGDELTVATLSATALSDETVLAENTNNFATSADFSQLYVLDTDYDLYYQTADGTQELVLHYAYTYRISADGTVCYIYGSKDSGSASGDYLFTTAGDGQAAALDLPEDSYVEDVANAGWFVYRDYIDSETQRYLYPANGGEAQLIA